MKIKISNVVELGEAIRRVRKMRKLTQQELALTANTAARYISDLENGKPTCQVGKALQVIACLGIEIEWNVR